MFFIQPDINIFAVLVGGVINMIVGSIWYSPKVLFNVWARELGRKPEDIKPAPTVFLYMFIGALILSYVLANVVRAFGASSILEGGSIGLIMWIGFVATTMIGNYAFAGRSWKLYGIDAGYHLIVFVLVAILHVFWI